VNIPEEILKMKQLNSLQNSEQKNKLFPERFKSVLRNEDYSNSFNRVETWLRNKSEQTRNAKNERSLVKMKNYFFSHKIRLAYAVIFLALVVAACSMPVTTHETMGNVITWSVDKYNTDAINKIEELPLLKNADQVNKNGNTDNGKEEIVYTVVMQKSTEEQIASFRNDLEKIGVSALKIIPINNNVKRPLYSAALNDFFSININATGMSDEELEQEITSKLKEAGINDFNIDFKTDDHGKRMLKLNIPDDQIKNAHENFELNVNDGNSREVMKMVHNKLDADKLKGMTDQQIKDQVKKDNPDLNLKDNDIKITREDGCVKVKVEREDVNNK
jgi:hypothetical protein